MQSLKEEGAGKNCSGTNACGQEIVPMVIFDAWLNNAWTRRLFRHKIYVQVDKG